MTRLEIALILFSFFETIISAIYWRKMMRDRARYVKLANEYENAISAIGVFRNAG